MGETMNVEDANASLCEIGRQDVSSFQSSRGFEFGEHTVQVSAEEANLLELASIQVRDAIRHQGCDISENESESMAAMQIDLGVAPIWETLRHPAPTNRVSIRRGFSCELHSTDNVTNKLTDPRNFEQPFLLTVRRWSGTADGGVQTTDFSRMQNA